MMVASCVDSAGLESRVFLGSTGILVCGRNSRAGMLRQVASARRAAREADCPDVEQHPAGLENNNAIVSKEEWRANPARVHAD